MVRFGSEEDYPIPRILKGLTQKSLRRLKVRNFFTRWKISAGFWSQFMVRFSLINRLLYNVRMLSVVEIGQDEVTSRTATEIVCGALHCTTMHCNISRRILTGDEN